MSCVCTDVTWEEARLFSSEAGVPTIFVTRPSPNVVCRVCKDVYLDPRIANDGFTYCRKCVPNLGDLAGGGGGGGPGKPELVFFFKLIDPLNQVLNDHL